MNTLLESIRPHRKNVLHKRVINNIEEGKGLEEIARLKWKNFRDHLATIAYSDILRTQIKQIENLIRKPEAKNALGKKVGREERLFQASCTLTQNQRACDKIYRADGLIQRLSFSFKKEDRFDRQINPYLFFAYQNKEVDKFIVGGNFYEKTLDKELKEIGPTIRLYLNTHLATTPELFERLVEQLKNKIVSTHCICLTFKRSLVSATLLRNCLSFGRKPNYPLFLSL